MNVVLSNIPLFFGSIPSVDSPYVYEKKSFPKFKLHFPAKEPIFKFCQTWKKKSVQRILLSHLSLDFWFVLKLSHRRKAARHRRSLRVRAHRGFVYTFSAGCRVRKERGGTASSSSTSSHCSCTVF